jgi:hypothetical protein
MEVLQLEIVTAGNGYYIAVYDETSGDFCRLSKETYSRFSRASKALFSGNWTIGF